MRGCLLFENAFPDASVSLQFATDSLTAAAEAHYPCATNIEQRFREDPEYFAKLVTAVSTPISEKVTE